MSYKIEKPYTTKQRCDFIVEFNHNKGLKIEETDTALYALEPQELLDGDTVVDNSAAYLIEQAQKERKRLDKLSLTKREVFLALYNAKGITPDEIRAQITDTASLIEFDYANEYYRGNELINSAGAMLGYSSDDLDYLFENKEFPSDVTGDTENEPDADDSSSSEEAECGINDGINSEIDNSSNGVNSDE